MHRVVVVSFFENDLSRQDREIYHYISALEVHCSLTLEAGTGTFYYYLHIRRPYVHAQPRD